MQIDTGKHLFVITKGSVSLATPDPVAILNVSAADEEQDWGETNKLLEEWGMETIPTPEPAPQEEQTPPEMEQAPEQMPDSTQPNIFAGTPEYDVRELATPGKHMDLDMGSLDQNEKLALQTAMADPYSYFKKARYYMSARPELDRVTGWLLDHLVSNEADKYFDLHLYRQDVANRWMEPAYRSLLESNPRMLVHKGVYRLGPMIERAPEMWEAVWEDEFKRAEHDPKGRMFPGDDIVRSLGKMATDMGTFHPKYFLENVQTRMSNLIESAQKDNIVDARAAAGMKNRLRKAEETARRKLEKEALVSYLPTLIKVADELDRKGEYELAEDLDNILRKFC